MKNKQKYNQWMRNYRKENPEIFKRINQRIKEKYPWYNSYNNAKQRCNNINNPNYPWYGKKGIKFLLTKDECAILWERDKASNLKFPTIDRIDNDGDYTFDNCQFIENIDNSIKDKIGHLFHGLFIKYCKIGQYTLDNKLIKVWNSQREIAKELGLSQGDISHCVNKNKLKSVGGFIFKKIKD